MPKSKHFSVKWLGTHGLMALNQRDGITGETINTTTIDKEKLYELRTLLGQTQKELFSEL